MKKSPAAMGGEYDFSAGDEQDKRARELVAKVQQDWSDNQDFYTDQDRWQKTRYSEIDRQVTMPWEGASDMNMPVSDLYATQLLPSMINLLFSGRKIAAMEPLDATAIETRKDAEKAFNVQLKRIPDFKMQMAHALNEALTGGRGVVKMHYSYKTRIISETIRARDLPGVLGKISYQPKVSERERQQMMLIISRAKPEDFAHVQSVFGEPASVLNKVAFDRHKGTIKQLAIEEFDWDIAEDVDRVACAEFMTWLRSGMPNASLVVKAKAVVEDTPKITYVSVNDIIVPLGTQDFRDADRLTHRIFLSKEDMISKQSAGLWRKDAVDKILESDPERAPSMGVTMDEMDITFRDRTSTHERGDYYELWEVYHYADIDGDGLPELVVTTVEPMSGIVVKEMEFPYDHGEMPFVWIPFEAHRPEYHASRGIPYILQDIESHLRAWHRALENHLTLSTTVTFAYRRNVFTSFDEVEFMPGLGIPVSDPATDIKALEMPQTSFPIERMEQFLMMWPERLIGGVDNQMDNEEGHDRPRTATQSQFIESARQRVVGMRATVVLAAFEKILRQTWALFRQYGQDNFTVFAGGERMERLTQHRIRGRFDVRPVGAIGNMDPTFRANNKLQILQMMMQVLPLVQQDPRYEADPVQTFVDWVYELDPVASETVIKRRPEEMVRQILGQQLQEAEAKGKLGEIAQRLMDNEEVSQEEMAMVMEAARKMAPHKDLQRITQDAQQAGALANQNRLIVGGGNGQA